MAKLTPSDSLWKLLREVDTPTVCNSIEVAQGRRGFDKFTKGTMLSSNPNYGSFVGYARTAKISGIEKPVEPPDEIRALRMKYFHHMAEGKEPKIAVVEDLDYPNCVSAWWGEVHTAVHKGLGVAGALTNGVMRDLGDLEPGFPVIAGSIGPSHAFVRATELATRVNIFGLEIDDGDLIHADRHGALVIPEDVIPNLENSIEKLISTEHIILGPAREPNFNIEKLEIAWKKFEKART
ncbi:MAG: RraA family protein [Paracoccaceae bacterium]|nr:RraA family protein [Paracoccaceae bacterium]